MGPRPLGSWSAYHSCSVKEKALCVPKAILRVVYVNRKKWFVPFDQLEWYG